jgi:hypothetical protein
MEKKESENQSEQVSAPQSAPATAQPQNGIAIAAMVVGIVAILLGLVPFAGLTLGITALVLGIIGAKKLIGKGMAIAGIVTGGLATLCNLAVITALIMGVAFLGGIFGGAVSTVGQIASNYNKEQQTKIDAKKDFSKGSTAVFDKFEVKANSVQRNYVPEDEYSRASDGKELIVVNVSVKNISSESASFYSYSLEINENGIAESASYLATVEPEFTGGSMSAGATATGNIVFEVTKGSTNLKLQYEDYAYNLNGSGLQTLTYTLDI